MFKPIYLFLQDFIDKESRWSSIRAISNSKMVKSAYIWLMIVPIMAKTLSSLGDELHLKLFGEQFVFNTQLPFAWQMLFTAAIFFALANSIYRLYCPDIIKLYKNYREFEHSGKTIDQTSLYLYDMVWESPGFQHIAIIARYFDRDLTAENPKEIHACFDNHQYFSQRGQTDPDYKSKAFYIVRDFAQTHNQLAIKTAISLYAIGFVFILAITAQNIIFVSFQT